MPVTTIVKCDICGKSEALPKTAKSAASGAELDALAQAMAKLPLNWALVYQKGHEEPSLLCDDEMGRFAYVREHTKGVRGEGEA